MATLLPSDSRYGDNRISFLSDSKNFYRPGAYGRKTKTNFGLKVLTTLLLAMLFSFTAYASHYKGGQITYQSMGGGTYKITVKSYWHSALPGSVLPTYSGSPVLNTNLTMVSLTPLPDGTTVEKVEEQTVTWPQPGLYTISWTSCCRISNGANFGITDMGLFAAVNYDPANPSSSPQFYDLPVFNYAANVPLSFGFNNSDPENHLQEYTLNTPYGSPSSPYGAMIATGFSVTNNGLVNWTNPQPGIWLVNVKLEEKINGVLTGAYVYRDFMLNIVPTTNHAPVLPLVAAKTILEGTQLQFTVSGSDPDGNMVGLRASGLPMNMSATFTQNTTGNAPDGTFAWTPPVGSAGTYSLQFIATDNVKPALSTQITVPIIVVSAACPITATAAVTNEPCGTNANGEITVSATGGSGNYTYSINGQGFQASNVFANLATGSYQIVVNDGNCSTSPQTVVVTGITLPAVAFANISDVCGNASPFTLTQGSPAGGTYSGPGVNNGIFWATVAGSGSHTLTYTYTINGCSASATRNVVVNSLLRANAGPDARVYKGYAPLACTTLNGAATGGNGPYTYLWSNGSTSASISVCPSVQTTYTLTVTDAAGCAATDQVIVNVTNAVCGNKNDKVLVCHKGNEICISANAVPAHLAHGCFVGSCNSTAGSASSARLTNLSTLQAVPNPFTESTILDFTLAEAGNYTLEVYDLKGTLIQKLEEGSAEANERRSVEINASKWAKGIYMARLITNSEVKTTKLMLIK